MMPPRQKQIISLVF